MLKVTEDQHVLIKEYTDVLNTVEEAFEYIVDSFTNLEKTEGDVLLADVFQALPQIVTVNEQLSILFQDYPSIQKVLQVFDVVMEKAELLDGNFGNAQVKQTVIREQLYPAFAAWSVMIQQELKPYVVL
ncbi:hypothetical protein [Cytobacillus gottheilii]|uniref:DUF8042 domain-containing protein n=1 Tax=Cytobacillus gottheilii TaxID=859144 RepID=A0ABX8F9W0_9BACI|nr:hypothetical protein [Cytobacillus gottheilii]QVY61206.1 hypothetical protein J1899_19950 [Cytobacillus gottheilii]